jgi:hypothetical protein
MKKEVKDLIPKIKKKVNAFLLSEEGKISKDSLVKIGGVLTGLASIGLVNAGGTGIVNEVKSNTYNSENGNAKAIHNNSHHNAVIGSGQPHASY